MTGESRTKIEPADRIYQFPLTDGTAWNETVTSATEGFGVVSVTTVMEDEVVDGWGTLVTPRGSEPALRLKKTRTATTGENALTTIAYLFLTNTGLGASIITDTLGAVFSSGGASYSLATAGGATAIEQPARVSFQLKPNYPNPFSDTTTLSFALESPGHTVLRVFDVLGREVATLVDGALSAGTHHADFHAGGLPSGVYVYTLDVGGAATVRSFILQR